MGSLFTFPDNDDKISEWLEALLLSPDFGATISQIADFDPDGLNDATKSLDDSEVEELAEIGLSGLSVEQCRWFLRNPERLAQLNEKIFEVGSPYWMQKLRASSSDDAIQNKVSSSISEFASSETVSHGQVQAKPLADVVPARRSFLKSTAGRLLTLAALVFIAVGIPTYLMLSDSGNNEWGWQSVAMTDQGSREAYLKTLDQSLVEWFDVSRSSQELLAKRLEQLSEGCDRLIDGEHGSLDPADQAWLLEKCEAWKVKINELAIAARAAEDVQQVDKIRNDADDLVAKISLAFKNRIELS